MQISEKFDKARTILHKVGIASTATTYSKKKLEAANPKQLEEAELWLDAFLGTFCTEIESVLKMVKPEIWERYKLLEITGLQEQKLLKSAKDRAALQWKMRPAILIKGKPNEQFKHISRASGEHKKGKRKVKANSKPAK
jgi:hypothetical protein